MHTLSECCAATSHTIFGTRSCSSSRSRRPRSETALACPSRYSTAYQVRLCTVPISSARSISVRSPCLEHLLSFVSPARHCAVPITWHGGRTVGGAASLRRQEHSPLKLCCESQRSKPLCSIHLCALTCNECLLSFVLMAAHSQGITMPSGPQPTRGRWLGALNHPHWLLKI